MPRWWWTLWAGALVGGVLCRNGDLVLWTSLATAMFGLFFWIAVANLWALAILATPAAWFWNRGRRGLGVGLSLALGLRGLLAWQVAIDAARASVLAENDQVRADHLARLPVSLEIGPRLARPIDPGSAFWSKVTRRALPICG